TASKAPEPIYPALSEIPPIPDYTDGGRSWNTDAVCWVGMTDDAKWNNIEGVYAQNQISSVILPLIREELSSEGYQVKIFDNDYITRDKRLSIHRIVLCKQFEIQKTMVKQGTCYDMKLTLDVINNPQHQENTQCEVWGRSLVISGERKPWVDVYRECVSNLHKVPEFRKALEVEPPI
ncbi:MAG: hypothetical protein ACYS9C_10600, partial [Planctomycetota bacterium]